MNWNVALQYQKIQERISQKVAARANSQKVTLVAVSKKQPIDAIEVLYHLGHRDFGENYAQELIEKAKLLQIRGCTEIRWHFIGHLQSNKIKPLLPHVSWIHTLDSEKLALKVSQYWKAMGKAESIPVFIEVNLDEEESKSGIVPSEVKALAQKISQISGLSLQGLMCIPKMGGDIRAQFKYLRDLELECRPYTQGKLSMGMSEDFELAIEEGATHVRIGNALFGPRL